MAVPAFVELSDAETAYKAAIGQDHKRKVKDNFTNLNSRIQTLENQVRLFDHFVDHHNDGKTPSALTDPSLPLWYDVEGGNKWRVDEPWRATEPGGDITAHLVNKPAYSVAGINASGSGDWVQIWSRLALRYDYVTLPITFEGRFTLPHADNGPIIGARQYQTTSPHSTDVPGVWLERVDGSNWRFSCYDTVRNSGDPFAQTAINTWFKVTIIITDDPSLRALCYIDDVLKETLTSQVPADKELCAAWGCNSGATSAMKADYVDYGAIAHSLAA